MPEKTVISDYVQDGLVLAYDGYQAPSGGVWKDLSPSHNDMVLTDGYEFDTSGHSLRVVAGNNHTTSSAVNFAANFTFEVVVQPNVGSYNTPIAANKSSVLLYNSSLYFRTKTNYICYVYLTTSSPCKTGLQVAYGDTCEARYYRNANKEWRKESGYLNHTAAALQLTFGSSLFNVDANFYALRLYNRKLTDAELLQNRKLDAARFDIPTTKIDQV